ncbi:MAG: S-methyl-5'-thioinosine phosphorylase [Thermoproteota archaeon]
MVHEKVDIAVVGGSGLYSLLESPRFIILDTPFGKTPRIEIGVVKGKKVAFLPRHGLPGSEIVKHAVPPSFINYRANIYGLRMLGVTRILATQAVGSINPKIEPGTFVIIDQFIDQTRLRPTTFYDGKTEIMVDESKIVRGVVHIDVTNPYCAEIRKALIDACREEDVKYLSKGVYVCTEGPRFETPAEIEAYRRMGADVVGMTNIPECVLARELAMCYASVAMSTNYAAGTGPVKITHEEVSEIFNRNIEKVRKVMSNAIERIPSERSCECCDALKGATA